MPLPAPTITLVNEIYEEIYGDKWTRDEDEALAKLWAQYPRNTDIAEVLLKVLTLNQLYKTRINDKDIYPLACYIVGLQVDNLLATGCLAAVEKIRECPALEKKPYSFASKFCSWHMPDVFPIYDSYVDIALWGYKRQDRFATFHRQDLWNYAEFVKTVKAFRSHFGLEGLSLRMIDKLLWSVGEKIKNGELQVEHPR